MNDPIKAAQVVEAVETGWGAPCSACGVPVLGQEIVLCLFAGAKDRPRCGPCLAAAMGLEHLELLRDGSARIRRLDCFRAGWAHADRRLATEPWPEARIPAELRMDEPELSEPGLPGAGPTGSAAEAAPAAASPDAAEARHHAFFDAGDASCGDLVLELRQRMLELQPGQVLLLRATDPSAPRDLPAWCGLTRHTLEHATPPLFRIRRRAD